MLHQVPCYRFCLLTEKFVIFVITFPFFLIFFFHFVHSFFVIIFLNLFLLNILKDLFNLHCKKKNESDLRYFFPLIFQWLQHNICQCWSPEFCRNHYKDNNDQIQHIRNNWLALSFSLLESHSEGLLVLLLVLFHSGPSDHIDPKGRFVSFKVTPYNDRIICVYAPLGYSTRKQLTRECFFEELQNYMKNKNKRNENRIILGEFTCTMNKMNEDGGNKSKEFIDVVPIMLYQNSLWMMGSRIYGEGST